MNDRVVVSLIVGGSGGFILWVIHGVARTLGLPRLAIYSGLVAAATFIVDFLTETIPEE